MLPAPPLATTKNARQRNGAVACCSRSRPSFSTTSSSTPTLLFWASLALVLISALLLSTAQAASLSIPVSEMLRAGPGDEPFVRDDRDYRPLQFGKRDSFRPLQFGKRRLAAVDFVKRGGAHYWPVDAADSQQVEALSANWP